MEPRDIYRFGDFVVDRSERAVYCSGENVPLTPKAFDLLLALVENRGRTMTKEELLTAVWPDTTVEEGNLTFQVSVLRKVLAQGGPEAQTFIQTVPRRGYRFVAAVTFGPKPGGDPQVPAHATSPPKRPVWHAVLAAALAVAAGLALYIWPRQRAGPTVLAVLPFRIESQVATDREIADGLADAIATRLGMAGSIVVRPALSTIPAYRKAHDPITSGRQLRADAVVSGTVRMDADRVRIDAQMWRVSDGRQLWANSFQAAGSELFRLEDDVSEGVAHSLSSRAAPANLKASTSNGSAYELYLRGRSRWLQWSGESAQRAEQFFEEAIRADPNYALAYSGLADAIGVQAHFGLLSPAQSGPRVRAAAERATALAPGLADAHATLGIARLMIDWDGRRAQAEVDRAVALNPNLAYAHSMRASVLCALGKDDLAERRRALELDPLSNMYAIGVGWAHFYARRYQQAVDEYHKALAADPLFPAAYWSLGEALEQQGKAGEAVRAFERAAELSARSPRALAGLAHAYGLAGRKNDALAIVDELSSRGARAYVSSYFFAVAYAGIGDRAKELEWLERAYQERSDWLVFLTVHPYFDNLRKDAAFQDLTRRIGLWNESTG